MIDSRRENPQITERECYLLAHIILDIRNLRTSGSCFDDMIVAKGNYGASMSNTCKIWDMVGPQIIFEEAGALCTDLKGNKLSYVNPLSQIKNTFNYCAGSPVLHKKLQKIIHQYF